MGLHPVRDLLAEALRRAALYYYETALRQIWPLHDDVPLIVHRINELRDYQ